MITGLDLVEWQLRVAAGEALPLTQAQLALTGHAIEARIYAESPENGFLPSIGTLSTLNFPPHASFRNGDARIDGGVQAGDTISPFYDPMIAKLIVRGADREQARARMIQALGGIQSVGVQTNIAFLRRLMSDAAFAAADLDTGLIERRHDSLLPPVQNAEAPVLALAVAALLSRDGLGSSRANACAKPVDPWAQADGWRVGGYYQRPFSFIDHGNERTVFVTRNETLWRCSIDHGETHRFEWQAETAADGNPRLRVKFDGIDSTGVVILRNDLVHVFADGGNRVLQLDDPIAQAHGGADQSQGGLTAPMPGKIISIHVKAGDQVKSGDALMVMEAMKMEHTILAPDDGRVEELFFGVGDQVADGAELIAMAAIDSGRAR